MSNVKLSIVNRQIIGVIIIIQYKKRSKRKYPNYFDSIGQSMILHYTLTIKA